MAGHNRWKDIRSERDPSDRPDGKPGPGRPDDFDVEEWRSFFIEHLGELLRGVIHVDEVDTDEHHIRGTSLHDIPIYIWFELASAPFAEGVELRMEWKAGTEKGWLDPLRPAPQSRNKGGISPKKRRRRHQNQHLQTVTSRGHTTVPRLLFPGLKPGRTSERSH